MRKVQPSAMFATGSSANSPRDTSSGSGLAQALLNNPEVLILDEPTIGLDPKQIFEVRALIKSLAGNHTVILSTHILPEVSMTCNRVVIINKGKVVAMDTPTGPDQSNEGRGEDRADGRWSEGRGRSKNSSHRGVLSVKRRRRGQRPARPTYIVECKLQNGSCGERWLSRKSSPRVGACSSCGAVSMSLEDVFINLVTQE